MCSTRYPQVSKPVENVVRRPYVTGPRLTTVRCRRGPAARVTAHWGVVVHGEAAR